jgi:secreted Zn-dependent insulinase-like peptidase
MMNESYHFTRLQELAEHVKQLDKETVLEFFDTFVAPSAPQRRKLCVQVFANQHAEKMTDPVSEKGVVVILDPAVFKRSMPLYPLPKHVEIKVSDLPEMDATTAPEDRV